MERIGSDTHSVAARFAALIRSGDRETPYEDLYSSGIVSVEPEFGLAVPWGEPDREGGILGPRVAEGIDAVLAKGDRWGEAFETHRIEAEDPFVDGDQFAVIYRLDLTHRASGERTLVRELGLYTVREGRIVREEFFASLPASPPSPSSPSS